MFVETKSFAGIVMIERFKRQIQNEFPFLLKGNLFLAISGGKDSMTLSHLLLQAGIKHTLLHCNFQLRGAESDADEQFIKNYAAQNDLSLLVRNFETEKLAVEMKLSIQEAARKLRYNWFYEIIGQDDYAYLLTAHHLDDSIETFFINLLRGTGYKGLAGIPILSGKVVRPLSHFTTDDIYRYIDEFHIEYRIDSSNAKKHYLRNKIRLDVIPAFIEIEPDFRQKMTQTLDEFRALRKFLDAEVIKFKVQHFAVDKDRIEISLHALTNQDSFFMENLFQFAGIYRKNNQSFLQFLTAGTGSIFETETHHFLIDRDKLIVTEHKTKQIEIIEQLVSDFPTEFEIGNQFVQIQLLDNYQIIKNNQNVQQFDLSKLALPLKFRKWKKGDKIKPFGMTGKKLISDILIDKKISLLEKENVLVIEDAQKRIIAILGMMISNDVKIEFNTERIIQIGIGSAV